MLRLMHQQLKLLVPLRMQRVLLDLRLHLALVTSEQPALTTMVTTHRSVTKHTPPLLDHGLS